MTAERLRPAAGTVGLRELQDFAGSLLPSNSPSAPKNQEQPDEVPSLVRRWQEEGDKAALDRLCALHQRTIKAAVRRWGNNQHQLRRDLEQAAWVGFLPAVEKYRPDRGATLASYATAFAIPDAYHVGPASSVGFRDRRPEARSGAEPAVRSSVKPSSAANDNLVERTTALWQPRLGRELTREDARQIVENVTGFFSILHEWSKANDNDNRESSAATGSGEARRDR